MKAFNEELEEIIIQALGHEVRRTILKIIALSETGALYTDLMTELGLPTGKLNYHLGKLEGLVEKNKERRYNLTPLGKQTMSVLNSITQNISSNYEKYVKIAQFAQKSTLHPILKSLIYLGIACISLVLFVWSFITYIVITEGAPFIVYILLPILIALGIVVLGWLVYALKKAPQFLKRFEKRWLG
ncbi:MAG: hypothetical protein ACFFCD_07520 [Promethearchaeota archaeon]